MEAVGSFENSVHLRITYQNIAVTAFSVTQLSSSMIEVDKCSELFWWLNQADPRNAGF